jgi:hypothetical protein
LTGIASNPPKALAPEEKNWIYELHDSDFSILTPAGKSKLTTLKTGNKEFYGIAFAISFLRMILIRCTIADGI